MFSKELLQLDRNTVQYMIDEMQDEIDASKKKLEEQSQQLNEEGRQAELGRAFSDIAFREQLLKEYALNN